MKAILLANEATNIKQVGAKAFNLNILKNLKLNVPSFFVINAEYLSSLINFNAAIPEIKTEIKNLIFSDAFSNELNTLIKEHFSHVSYFSVRSSAVNEDGDLNSFAGQFETYLYIKSNELIEHIKLVWLSLFNTIKENETINWSDNSIAVIIQEIIDSDVSGVAFGENPLNKGQKEFLINATYGLGVGIVNGDVPSDLISILPNKQINYTTELKQQQYKNTNNKGFGLVHVPQELQDKNCINTEHILEILKILESLNTYYKKPQDIEFAIQNGTLFLLQTRPITTLNKASDFNFIWDNNNIMSSYPDTTLPLSFSFVKKTYEIGYTELCKTFGIKHKYIEANRRNLGSIIGLLKGKMYYNLSSIYNLISIFPIKSLKQAFQNTIGIEEDRNEETKIQKFNKWELLVFAYKLVTNLIFLKKNRQIFDKDFQASLNKINAIDLSTKNSKELIEIYHTHGEAFIKQWKAPVVNGIYVMIWYRFLKKYLEKNKCLIENPNLYNDILDFNETLSYKCIHELNNLISFIQNQPSLSNSIKNCTVVEFADALKMKPEFSILNEKIEAYLKEYGDRSGVGELKMETVSYKQNKHLFYEVLQQNILANIAQSNKTASTNKADQIQYIKQKLKNNWFKISLFNFLLKKTNDAVFWRENFRFYRTKGFGSIKFIFSQIAENFHKKDIIEQPSDLYYLTIDEISNYIYGSDVILDIKNAIKLRKLQYIEFNKNPFNESRIKSNNEVGLFNFEYPNLNMEQNTNEIIGKPCSSGISKAFAVIVNSPFSSKLISNYEGKILVAQNIDPSWVQIFPLIKGLVLERGNLLSHISIMARENNLPCVIGASNASKTIQENTLIEINGNTGIIKTV